MYASKYISIWVLVCRQACRNHNYALHGSLGYLEKRLVSKCKHFERKKNVLKKKPKTIIGATNEETTTKHMHKSMWFSYTYIYVYI